MNKTLFAGVGVLATAATGVVAGVAVSGTKKLVKKLVDEAYVTPNPGVDGQPFQNSRYYREGDYSIHYRLDFAKTPQPIGKMFMIHGFACNTTFFDEMVELYTGLGFTCLRVDAPNCGYSTRETAAVKPIDREDLFFHVMDVVDASGAVPAGKWLLVGHSMGGGISMNMAYDNPNKFNAVVLYAPMAAVNAPSFVKSLVTLEPMCNIVDKVFGTAACNDVIMKSVVMLMTVDVRYSALYDVKKFSDGLTVDKSGTGMCYMMARARPTLHKNMSEVKLPIQLVWGKMDLFNTKGTIKKFEAALTNPDVSRVQLAGHCLVQNVAGEVVDGTVEFLRKNGIYSI